MEHMQMSVMIAKDTYYPLGLVLGCFFGFKQEYVAILPGHMGTIKNSG